MLPALIILALFSASWLVLSRAGEFLPAAVLAQKQIEKGGIYNSALYQRTFRYKLALYKDTKPDVIVLGSSRVLQFSQESFHQKFLNMGSISGLDELATQIKEILQLGKPKTIVLGLDYWWFNDAYIEAYLIPQNNRHLDRIRPTIGLLSKPFIWLVNGQIKAGDTIKLLDKGSDNIGVYARLRRDGYSSDGSYAYTSIINGSKPSDDPQFAGTISRAAKKDKYFSFAQNVPENRWKKLQGITSLLQENGIQIILVMPPFPSPVLQILSSNDEYGYITRLRARLRETGLPFYDFHDPATFGANSCEFIDGLHGGPVVYRRMANAMALKYPAIFRVAPLNPGHASMDQDETDFLKLGCKK